MGCIEGDVFPPGKICPEITVKSGKGQRIATAIAPIEQCDGADIGVGGDGQGIKAITQQRGAADFCAGVEENAAVACRVLDRRRGARDIRAVIQGNHGHDTCCGYSGDARPIGARCCARNSDGQIVRAVVLSGNPVLVSNHCSGRGDGEARAVCIILGVDAIVVGAGDGVGRDD